MPGIARGLNALPLSHAYGLLVAVVGLHAVQRHPTVLMRWFDPERWLELAQEHRTQITAVVPSMLQLLLALPVEDYDLSELRYIVSGGAPLPPETAEELIRRVPQVEIREGYGLTETAALVSSTPPGQARLGSVGKPVPGVDVRIDGDGDVGEICVRSRSVMLGYWQAPAETAEAIEDGWLRTGDLGYLDADGYLYVVDRKKDLIIRGGFNVFPRDVEEALLEHPSVAAAGVVGRPDENHGEEVVAFVELKPGQEATSDELVSFGKERIGGYKYPREVHIIGSLPLTPVGKIDRKALRDSAPGGGDGVTTKLTLAELEAAEDLDLGTSDWETIEQSQIDQFAEATHDHQWIHVDPEMAAQGPFGTTVAHGYLSLSMLPYFVSQVLNVSDVRMGINYGTEKIRFTAPVPVGSQVRLKATLREQRATRRRRAVPPRRRDRDQGRREAGARRRSAVPRLLG